MKILVTGGSGMVGKSLKKYLPDATYISSKDYDLTSEMQVYQMFNNIKPDTVIHLAALVRVGESEVMPIKYYITNLNGTMNVVNKIKTKNFIFSSTGAAQDCSSAYGISKRAAEDVVKEFCTTHRPTPYTIFRFYNVIGSEGFTPTNPDGLMYKLMKARETGQFTIYGNDYDVSDDGTCIRDYVHVNEICDALMQAIEKPSNSVECLGHGVGYTVQEIVDLFQKVNECVFEVKYGPRRKGDLASSVLENVSTYMRNLYTMDQLIKV